MRVDEFDYLLPEELIAQTPLPRGESRMLVLHRFSGEIELRKFIDLPLYLCPHDTIVLNDTRVSARRLQALKEAKPVELLLLRPQGDREWTALVRPGKRVKPGAKLSIVCSDGLSIEVSITGTTPEGGRIIRCATSAERDSLAMLGVVPLPPYIRASLADEERYQTVYSGPNGSAAAPTAGLHLTREMLQSLKESNVNLARVTLHVGVDTFRPVRAEMAEDHVMHGEWYSITAGDSRIVNETHGRILAVGTTTVRALESSAQQTGRVEPITEETRLFITPGYEFKVVSGILTNFHLPKSTLLMLVSAFAGREAVMEAYRRAIDARFRFYSFGDAMLII